MSSVCGEHLWVVNKELMDLRGFNNGDMVLGGGSAVMDKIANKKMITIKRYNPNDSAAWNAFVDPSKKGTFMLKRPYQGLYIVPGIWRELDDFSSGAVCLVLASEMYDENDYIRDYKEFIKYKDKK